MPVTRAYNQREIRAIAFDAVGTLLRPQPSAAHAYQQAAREFGLDVSIAEIESRFQKACGVHLSTRRESGTNQDVERQRWRCIVGEVFAGYGDNVQAIYERLWEHFADPGHWELFPDVEPFLRTLPATLTCAIASNFDERLERVCDGFSCFQRFRIYHSAGIGISKPNLAFYRAIEERLSATPIQLLMVGDHPENDLLAPQRAGWNALLLNRSSTSAADALVDLRDLRITR